MSRTEQWRTRPRVPVRTEAQTQQQDVGAPLVSIVVPVLNEAPIFDAALRRLTRDFPGCELIVVDGGSSDGSDAIAARHTRVLRAGPGRAVQMNAGARAAAGDVLWFVHADTSVDPTALGQLREVCADPGIVAGGCTLRFDRDDPGLRYVAWASNQRARRLRWIFGDQAMFVRRCAFESVGGFPELPIMEDLEMSRRLTRTGRTVLLTATSTASARRFDEVGTFRLLVYMQWLKLSYFAGTDPAELARRYADGPPLRRRRTAARFRGSANPRPLGRRTT